MYPSDFFDENKKNENRDKQRLSSSFVVGGAMKAITHRYDMSHVDIRFLRARYFGKIQRLKDGRTEDGNTLGDLSAITPRIRSLGIGEAPVSGYLYPINRHT